MNLHHFNPANREYTHSVAAPICQLEKTPQTMVFSTLAEPLPNKDGYSQVHIEATDSWEYVIDKRGTVYWLNGEKKTHTELGEPPEGASLSEPEPTAEQLWADRQASAQTALTASDVTILRCYENGVAVPAEWAEYRAALRAIISAASGDASQALPTRPEYPEGT